MKKIISIFVAVMLIFLISVSTFAYDIDATPGNGTMEGVTKDDFGGSTSVDVQIQINGEINHRYAVDITFNAPVFTLNTNVSWQPDEHEYSHNNPIVWEGVGTVIVENHSDMPIIYSATAEVTSSRYGNLAIVFNGDSTYSPLPVATLAGCAIRGTAPSAEFTYGVKGTPNVASLSVTKLGIITVIVDATD